MKSYTFFHTLLNNLGMGYWYPEHMFHPNRRWRFDFAQPKIMVAVEIDGGCFVHGRHSRGVGQIKDMEKMNEAQKLGWRVFHFTPQQTKGYAICYAITFLQEALCTKNS